MSTTNTEDAMRRGPPNNSVRYQVARAINSADGGPPVVNDWGLQAADAALLVIREAADAMRWLPPDQPNSRIADDVGGWRAWRSHEKGIDSVVGLLIDGVASPDTPREG